MRKLALLVVIVFVLGLTSCTISIETADGNKTSLANGENPEINLDYLVNNSQLCLVVYSSENYVEEVIYDKEVIKDGKIYITRAISVRSNNYTDSAITIVQPEDSYIDLNGIYILFLNEAPNEAGVYTIVGGKSSVIYIYEPNKIKSDNKDLQKDVKKRFNGKFSEFYEWFDGYYGIDNGVKDDDELSTTLPNSEDYSDVITTAKPE